MNIVVWSALGGDSAYTTGVGKHIANVVQGLASQSNWDVRLLLSSDLRGHSTSKTSAIGDLSAVRMPISRRVIEASWRTTNRPYVDRWVKNADWIYCPKELYVPTKRCRYAVTVHDLYPIEPDYSKYQSVGNYRWHRLLPRMLAKADLVLTVSQFTKSRLLALTDVESEKVRIIGNGVEKTYFQVGNRNPDELTPVVRSPYILSVGGITYKKGAERLLAAAAKFAKVRPDLTLVVVGPIEAKYERTVRGASNLLVIDRGINDSEMCCLIKRASVMLALSEYEGFGIPAVEAMAAGVPVVAVRKAALPEVIGEAGLLVNPDPNEITDAISVALHDLTVRTDLVEKGKKRAKRYSWNECVERIVESLVEFDSKEIEKL